jgi:hypothetical protein
VRWPPAQRAFSAFDRRDNDEMVLLILLAVDSFLLGLGVTVMLVTYPSFDLVGDAEWPAFHQHHTRRITWAVAPAWMAQGFLAGLWILLGPNRVLAVLHGTVAGLAVLATIVGAVPRHDRLSAGRSADQIRSLMRWHALRTGLWLIATGIALVGILVD